MRLCEEDKPSTLRHGSGQYSACGHWNYSWNVSAYPRRYSGKTYPSLEAFSSALQRSCAADHSLAKSSVSSYDLQRVINFKFRRARVFPLCDLTIIKFLTNEVSENRTGQCFIPYSHLLTAAFTVQASSKGRDVRPSTIRKDSVHPGIAMNHVAGAWRPKPGIDSISGHRKVLFIRETWRRNASRATLRIPPAKLAE